MQQIYFYIFNIFLKKIGFNLDAYVVVGTNSERDFTWVLVKIKSTNNPLP